MFNFLKKSSSSARQDSYPIKTDMHSHILPGIDDGSPDIDSSLQLILGLKNLGIHKAVATPHVLGDMYRNDRTSINRALTLVQTELQNRQIDFELSAAAEYMLDSYFLTLLQDKSALLTVKDNLLLTEFSYAAMPDNPGEMSFAIITEGFVPILAHPERYAYYHNNYDFYHHLKDLGFLLQVNLLSLTGYYGKEVAKAAQYLIKNNLVSYAGTDMHHQRHLDALTHPKNQQMFSETFGGMELDNLRL